MEITRKWMLKTLPDILKFTKVECERYFLYIDDKVEIRIQKQSFNRFDMLTASRLRPRITKYEFERKETKSKLSRTENKFDITKNEFMKLKKYSKLKILRTTYIDRINATFSIQVYKGKFKGLIRAEIDFDTERSANEFKSPKHFGKEITYSILGRDKTLVQLSKDKYIKMILNQPD